MTALAARHTYRTMSTGTRLTGVTVVVRSPIILSLVISGTRVDADVVKVELRTVVPMSTGFNPF